MGTAFGRAQCAQIANKAGSVPAQNGDWHRDNGGIWNPTS